MSADTVTRPSRAAVARALERDVLAGCLEACRALGIPAQRRNTGAMAIEGRRVRFGKPGDPDIDGTIPRGPQQGKRLGIEVKRPGERPRPAQLQRLAEVRAAGGIAFWCDDAADCLRVLQRVLEGAWIELDEAGSQWVVWASRLPDYSPGIVGGAVGSGRPCRALTVAGRGALVARLSVCPDSAPPSCAPLAPHGDRFHAAYAPGRRSQVVTSRGPAGRGSGLRSARRGRRRQRSSRGDDRLKNP